MATVIELIIGGETKRSTKGKHPVKIDWDALPDVAQMFAIRYGLKQYLADGMAGAANEAEAKASVEERVAKLLSGDLSRTRGEGKEKPDTVETRALKLARAFIRDTLKAKNMTAEKEKVAAAAAKLVETQPKWKAEADKQLKAEAKAKEALADDETADILADLIGDAEEESEGDEE